MFEFFRPHKILRQLYHQKHIAKRCKATSSLTVHSPYRDVEKVVGISVPDMIWARSGDCGESTAFECDASGAKYSYNQVFKSSRSFANSLLESGMKAGDVVGIGMPNVPEYAAVLFGIWDAGLIATNINPASSVGEITSFDVLLADELENLVRTAGAKCIVTISDRLPTVRAVQSQLHSQVNSVIIVGEPHLGCHTFSEMAKSSNTEKVSRTLSEHDVALLQFSSGTTGAPKGVQLTHSNLSTNLLQSTLPELTNFEEHFQTGFPQEKLLGLLPFYHIFGQLEIIHKGMFLGSHTVCLQRYNPDLMVQAMRKHKPTILQLVPPIVQHLAYNSSVGAEEFKNVHTLQSGAARTDPDLIHILLGKAKKYFFYQQVYGMTEVLITNLLSPETKNQNMDSIGSLVSSTLAKIIDVETGLSLKPYEKGEICLKGPQITKGYLRNEEANRNSNLPDNWFRTGDIGYYDSDNCFYITGRLKEIIKVNGFQVSPLEIEICLLQHPAILDVGVIGIPDKYSESRPRGYIIPKPGVSITEEQVHNYLKNKLSYYKQLKGGIEFVSELPKSPAGKLLRGILLKDYLIRSLQ